MRPMVTALGWTALAACGRLEFDPVTSGDDSAVTAPATIVSATFDLGIGVPGGLVQLRSPVDVARSLLLFSATIDSPTASDTTVRGWLASADEIRFERQGAAAAAKIAYQVVTWSGWTVQRGTTSLPGLQFELRVPLPTPVEIGSAFPIVTSSSDGTSLDEDDALLAEISAPNELRLSLVDNLVSPTDIAWQVVEIPTARVLAGTTVMDTSATIVTATLATFDPSRSWLVFSHAGDVTSSSAAAYMVAGSIADGQTVLFERDGTGVQVRVAYHLIELANAIAERGNEAFTTELTRSVSITAPDVSRSFVYGGGFSGRSGRSPHSINTSPGAAWVAAVPGAGQQLQLKRSLDTSPATIPWQVIELR